MKKIIVILFCLPLFCFAQTGGQTSFNYLNLAYNARSAGLGGDFITVKDKDVNLGVSNPSLYNSLMNKSVGFSQAFLAGGINYGMVSYARNYKDQFTYAGNIRYVNYGKMDRTDVAGNVLGSFYASEYIIGAGFGKQINPVMTIGGNLNLLYSQLDTYSSLGASLDFAGSYSLDKSNTFLTFVAKNIGYQFKTYTGTNRAPLPTDIQLGISHKLAHAPFRFSVLMHHLNRWDIAYFDPNTKPKYDALTGDTIAVKHPNFIDKLGQHFTLQAEILLGKSLHIRTAFDIHRRQNMKIDVHPGMAGFSFGVGMYFKRISIDYGLVIYSKAGYNNMLTLTTDLSKWKK